MILLMRHLIMQKTRTYLAQFAFNFAIILPLACLSSPSRAESTPLAVSTEASYPGLAKLHLLSDVVLQARIYRSKKLSSKQAPDVAAGFERFLIQADVQSVILSSSPIPQRISYIWDAPVKEDGSPKLKGISVILFLKTVTGRDDFYQLAAPNAQLLAQPEALETTRSIAADPDRSAIGDFHFSNIMSAIRVRSTEDSPEETNFLIQTSGGQLYTAIVTNTSNDQPLNTVRISRPDSLNESQSVKKRTLIWYHLACDLPGSLPSSLLDAEGVRKDAALITQDYRTLRQILGPCQ